MPRDWFRGALPFNEATTGTDRPREKTRRNEENERNERREGLSSEFGGT